MTQPDLSPQARRILDTLHAIARDAQVVATSWTEIMRAAQVGRSYVAGAMRELKAARAIEQISGAGERAKYRLLCTGAHRFEPVRTGSPDEYIELNLNDDERAALSKKLGQLLGEFLVAEPIRSQLVAQLLPMVAHEPSRETEIRAICERTINEHVWRNKPGVIVRRLRALASGQQDPLPVFHTVMSAMSAPQSRPGYPGRRGTGKLIRRAQVPEANESEREAAREAARRRIEERARRRAAGAICDTGARAATGGTP